jgi:hypothetical protein
MTCQTALNGNLLGRRKPPLLPPTPIQATTVIVEGTSKVQRRKRQGGINNNGAPPGSLRCRRRAPGARARPAQAAGPRGKRRRRW